MFLFQSIILPLFLFLSSSTSDNWIIVKEKGDIQVFVRQQNKGDFKEVKILTHVHCTMKELVASLEDVSAHKDWVMNTLESKIIEEISPNNFYYYLSTDMPFPLRNRDLVIYYNRYQDEETGVVYTTSSASADKIPAREGFIRIHSFESTYILTPSSGDIIDIEYKMKVDPGGILPAWLVNLAVTKGPVTTMESLFTLIQSNKYENAQVANIFE